MIRLGTYKAATALILVALAASSGATALYFNQKNTELNSALNDINGQLTDLDSQISQLKSQNSQLTSQTANLTHQIELLQSQLFNLTTSQLQYEATPIIDGVVTLSGGIPQYVTFTAPSTQTALRLNISAYMSATPGGNQIPSFSISLLNQTQYDSFVPWGGSGLSYQVSILDDSACPTNAAACKFDPAQIKVPTGQTVSWTNRGNLPHTVHSCTVSNNPSATACPTMSSGAAPDLNFASSIINPGQTFSEQFTTPGTYYYYCNIHQ